MAERKLYTDLQKAEILKKAEETTVAAAAKEFGVDRKTIAKWKASAAVTAGKIEAKKKTRTAGRNVKSAVSGAVSTVKGDVRDAADKAKLADEMASGKAKAKTARKKAEKKEAAAQKTVRKTVAKNEKAARRTSAKKKAVKLNLIIQSPMGGEITPAQIALRLPKDAADAYVRIDLNKVYYVLKSGETGSIDIWE